MQKSKVQGKSQNYFLFFNFKTPLANILAISLTSFSSPFITSLLTNLASRKRPNQYLVH